ncbi:type II secretion system protein, partial [Pseudomonas aeruginosa]
MSSEPLADTVPAAVADARLLGQMLIERGLCNAQELERALELQARIGGRLGALLLRSGGVSEAALLEVLAEQLRLPLVGVDLESPGNAELLAFLEATSIGVEWFVAEQVVVWNDAQGGLLVASRDPMASFVLEVLRYF